MAIEKVESKESKDLEPNLICSKDGKILERSERESVRAYEGALFSVLSDFLAGWRF